MESVGKAAIAEFIGTFALIFFAGGTIIATGNGDLLASAFAYGLAMAIMVSLMARISGGVFNPATQVALWVTGKSSTLRCGVSIAAQVLGAVAAAALLKYFSPAAAFDSVAGGTPQVSAGYQIGKAVLVEAVATFFLVWAYFGSVVDERGAFAKVGGFAVGLVVTIDVLAVGTITGAAVNPARWFGPALVSGTWTNGWVWIVGPIAGGIIAGVAYWFLSLQGGEPATP